MCVDGRRRAEETAQTTHAHTHTHAGWFIKPTTMSYIYEYGYMCIFMWDRRWHRMSRRDLSADSDTHTHIHAHTRGRRGCPFLRPSRRWQISGRPRKAVCQNLWLLTYTMCVCIYVYSYVCHYIYIYIYMIEGHARALRFYYHIV